MRNCLYQVNLLIILTMLPAMAAAQYKQVLRAGIFGAVGSSYSYQSKVFNRALNVKVRKPKQNFLYSERASIQNRSKGESIKPQRRVSFVDLNLATNIGLKQQREPSDEKDLNRNGWKSF